MDKRNKVLTELDLINARMQRARTKMADLEITTEDYRMIKRDRDDRIVVLEDELSKLKPVTESIDVYLRDALKVLYDLRTLYSNGDVHMKRLIIDALWPEKLKYDGLAFRTTRISDGQGGYERKKTVQVEEDPTCTVRYRVRDSNP